MVFNPNSFPNRISLSYLSPTTYTVSFGSSYLEITFVSVSYDLDPTMTSSKILAARRFRIRRCDSAHLDREDDEGYTAGALREEGVMSDE